MFDAEEYTLSVRLECFEDEKVYVARVEELPDIEEYADSYEFARTLALDTIRVTQEIFRKRGMQFPHPKQFKTEIGVSGRITLRLKKSTHAKAIEIAESEGVSLNSYISSCVENGNSSQEFTTMMKKIESIDSYVRSMSAEQSEKFTLISSIVKNQSVTMRSKVTFDMMDEEFDHRAIVHKFLKSQDMSYTYD